MSPETFTFNNLTSLDLQQWNESFTARSILQGSFQEDNPGVAENIQKIYGQIDRFLRDGKITDQEKQQLQPWFKNGSNSWVLAPLNSKNQEPFLNNRDNVINYMKANQLDIFAIQNVKTGETNYYNVNTEQTDGKFKIHETASVIKIFGLLVAISAIQGKLRDVNGDTLDIKLDDIINYSGKPDPGDNVRGPFAPTTSVSALDDYDQRDASPLNTVEQHLTSIGISSNAGTNRLADFLGLAYHLSNEEQIAWNRNKSGNQPAGLGGTKNLGEKELGEKAKAGFNALLKQLGIENTHIHNYLSVNHPSDVKGHTNHTTSEDVIKAMQMIKNDPQMYQYIKPENIADYNKFTYSKLEDGGNKIGSTTGVFNNAGFVTDSQTSTEYIVFTHDQNYFGEKDIDGNVKKDHGASNTDENCFLAQATQELILGGAGD